VEEGKKRADDGIVSWGSFNMLNEKYKGVFGVSGEVE